MTDPNNYRVYFSVPSGYFYTEWFETKDEAFDFLYGIEQVDGMSAIHVEDTDGIVH